MIFPPRNVVSPQTFNSGYGPAPTTPFAHWHCRAVTSNIDVKYWSVGGAHPPAILAGSSSLSIIFFEQFLVNKH